MRYAINEQIMFDLAVNMAKASRHWRRKKGGKRRFVSQNFASKNATFRQNNRPHVNIRHRQNKQKTRK